jgi:hypothetical protein
VTYSSQYARLFLLVCFKAGLSFEILQRTSYPHTGGFPWRTPQDAFQVSSRMRDQATFRDRTCPALGRLLHYGASSMNSFQQPTSICSALTCQEIFRLAGPAGLTPGGMVNPLNLSPNGVTRGNRLITPYDNLASVRDRSGFSRDPSYEGLPKTFLDDPGLRSRSA